MPTGAAGATNAAAYASYLQMLQNINGWYTNSADGVWNVINDSNLTVEQTAALVPVENGFTYGQGANAGYSIVKAADGSVLSWNNTASLQVSGATPLETALDSNAGMASQQMYQLPANTTYTQPEAAFNASKGVTGGSVVNVMSQVSAGMAAAGLGIKLGKAIDSALYNLNPDFWDNHGMSSLNPETWNRITVDMKDTGWEGTLKRAFNAIFGLNPNTGETQMYLDSDAAAYLAMYMQSKGVFDRATQSAGVDAATESALAFASYHPPFNLSSAFNGYSLSGSTPFLSSVIEATSTARMAAFKNASTKKIYFIIARTDNDTCGKQTLYNTAGDIISESWLTTLYNYTFDNKTVYYLSDSRTYSDHSEGAENDLQASNPSQADRGKIAWVLAYGTVTGGQTVDGITDQDGATQPDFTGCETPEDYKQALQQQYPEMFQNPITQNVAQPDGSVIQKVYIPVGTPSTTGTQDPQPVTDPQTSGQSQPDPVVNPQNVPIPVIEALTRAIENLRTPDTPDTPNPPDTGEGNTPTVVAPTGSASALWSVYNPTQAQLNSFGAWLWSSNFIDQVLKLFNNPMQSIIGVHKIFAQPAISGSGNIVVGYLDSGVGSNLVGAQYTTVNCGSVSVREQFGNVFDYTDTQVRLYLPFIGIVDLDTNDVMRGTVSVVYHVDVITGACLAEVRITRDGAGGTLYQFAGDASVRYPISSGSYMGIVAGIASAVGGVASAIATGGATLPLAAGAVAGGLSGAKTNVQHSGSFGGNAGAMGAKKPYLIIERPQTLIADSYGKYQGKGANAVRTVSQCSGYFKMSDVHTDSISGASAAEVQAIRTALENGVIK